MDTIKTIRMSKADAEKWLAALRSGEYKQGILALQDRSGGYCCLGVMEQCLTGAVEMHSNFIVTGVACPLDAPSLPWLDQHKIKFSAVLYNGSIDPGRRIPYVQLTEDFTGRHERFTAGAWVAVSSLNDEDMPFDKIADLIEAHLETY
jgi:hypothetical protein